jgi:hypothetical protein
VRLAIVWIKYKIFFIDKTGWKIVELGQDGVKNLNEGMALICIDDNMVIWTKQVKRLSQPDLKRHWISTKENTVYQGLNFTKLT